MPAGAITDKVWKWPIIANQLCSVVHVIIFLRSHSTFLPSLSISYHPIPKEARMRQKMRELHELPCTEMVKSETFGLASEVSQMLKTFFDDVSTEIHIAVQYQLCNTSCAIPAVQYQLRNPSCAIPAVPS